MRATASLVVLGSLLAGCPDKSAEKSEAAAIDRAIDALRDAPNESKAPALEALRKLHCSTPDTCAAQSACVAGYDLHLQALRGIEETKRAAADPDAAPGRNLAALAEAGDALQRSKQLTDRCADVQGEIARKYRL